MTPATPTPRTPRTPSALGGRSSPSDPPSVPEVGLSALSRCTAVDRATFAQEHWSNAPLLSRAKQLPQPFDDLLSLADVDELVADRALRTPFFRTVREGGSLPDPVRTITAGGRRLPDAVDPDALIGQYTDGATLVLNALHRLHPPIASFCRRLAAELGHPVQCNAYVTPAGQHQGFAFHHDTHDVFVLQVSGRKRWIVHAPVVRLPLASQPRAGADLVPDGADALLDVELEAGDALYLPRGYVHAAVSTDEDSVHLTVGVLATTWYDLLVDAVALAGEDEAFRDALPLRPQEGLDLRGFLGRAADFFAAVEEQALAGAIAPRLARAVPPEPVQLLATADAVRGLTPGTVVRPRVSPSVVVEGDQVVLVLPRKRIALPVACERAVRGVLAGPVSPADLPDLDTESALVLVRRLLREGVLTPV